MPYPAELREQIEALALEVVTGAGAEGQLGRPSWIEQLKRIRETAEQSQAAPVAAAAATLIELIGSGKTSVQVDEGIARLQEALESGAQAVPEAEKSPASDPELMADFVLESREHLAGIETQVLTLEREPSDAESLNAIFRGFHSIKGLAGFLELWEMQSLAHEVETVLDHARNGRLTITPGAIDVVLESADHLRRWLTHVEAGLLNQASEPPNSDEGLVARIRSLISNTPEPVATPELSALAAAVASEPQPETPSARAARPSEAIAVKVDTAKLDSLVDMAGELVIAESLVRHDPDMAGLSSPRLQRKIAQLNRITGELQKTAMAMRLVPIGSLFRRMARLVRDLSRQVGKRVELETTGADIELDRTIVEELADPFMHMIRNALDHGIEAPAERQQSGKGPTARLHLKAQHQAGQVLIEIADDGRGLDRTRIQAKAIEKGLLAPGEERSDNEIYNLIFEPGFSTAAKVTNVSGRGVGMDVVRKHVEKLRGRIEVHSTPGKGATFILKVPLTLAIIDGLVVGVGKERYIVPLFSVREMFRPGADTMWTVQERVEMALVRGTLFPVLRLYRRFNVQPRSENPADSVLVVAEVEGQRFCLMVDDLIGKQEVVIKSLGETFKNISGVAGGAILGDGRVGLILDLDRLFKERSGEAGR